MSLTSINDVTPGASISFRSKNPNDLVVWTGTLLSVGVYLSIRPYMDPTSYNEAVRQSDPSVSSDVTTLTYFLIQVDNNASEPDIQAFADEWITSGSLVVTTLGKSWTLVVQDPNNNVNPILSLLANAGYAVTVST